MDVDTAWKKVITMLKTYIMSTTGSEIKVIFVDAHRDCKVQSEMYTRAINEVGTNPLVVVTSTFADSEKIRYPHLDVEFRIPTGTEHIKATGKRENVAKIVAVVQSQTPAKPIVIGGPL